MTWIQGSRNDCHWKKKKSVSWGEGGGGQNGLGVGWGWGEGNGGRGCLIYKPLLFYFSFDFIVRILESCASYWREYLCGKRICIYANYNEMIVSEIPELLWFLLFVSCVHILQPPISLCRTDTECRTAVDKFIRGLGIDRML